MQPSYGNQGTDRPAERLSLRMNKARAMAAEAIRPPILSPVYETRPLHQAPINRALRAPNRKAAIGQAVQVAVSPLDFPR